MVRNVWFVSVILADQFASATRNRGADQFYSVFSLPGIWKLRPSRSRGERSASIRRPALRSSASFRSFLARSHLAAKALSSAMTLKCPCADIDYHQQKPGQNRSSADAAAFFRRSLCAAFVSIDSCIKPATLASTRRPALRSSASLKRGPTSCKLVTGIVLPFTGIGIASAGFPAKFTATVFCRPNTRASKMAILPMSGIVGGSV